MAKRNIFDQGFFDGVSGKPPEYNAGQHTKLWERYIQAYALGKRHKETEEAIQKAKESDNDRT